MSVNSAVSAMISLNNKLRELWFASSEAEALAKSGKDCPEKLRKTIFSSTIEAAEFAALVVDELVAADLKAMAQGGSKKAAEILRQLANTKTPAERADLHWDALYQIRREAMLKLNLPCRVMWKMNWAGKSIEFEVPRMPSAANLVVDRLSVPLSA
jgi:hypothetical protein